MQTLQWLFDNQVKLQQLAFDVLTASTAFVVAARGLVALLRKLADWTSNKADDHIIGTLSMILDGAANALDAVHRFVPHVTVRGEKKEDAAEAEAPG